MSDNLSISLLKVCKIGDKKNAISLKRDVISLLELGAGVDPVDKSGDTPLSWACHRNFPEIVEILADAGADIDFCNPNNNHGYCLLHFMCERGNYRIAKILLDKGADPNKKTANKNTPLHIACSRGDSNMAVLLIINGSEINVMNKLKITPIEIINSRFPNTKFIEDLKEASKNDKIINVFLSHCKENKCVY